MLEIDNSEDPSSLTLRGSIFLLSSFPLEIYRLRSLAERELA